MLGSIPGGAKTSFSLTFTLGNKKVTSISCFITRPLSFGAWRRSSVCVLLVGLTDVFVAVQAPLCLSPFGHSGLCTNSRCFYSVCVQHGQPADCEQSGLEWPTSLSSLLICHQVLTVNCKIHETPPIFYLLIR